MVIDTMPCPACKKEIPGSAALCEHCGKGISGQYLLAEEERRRMNLKSLQRQTAADAATDAATGQASNLGRGLKSCPFCAEEILQDAIKCKHCKSELVKQCPSCRESIQCEAAICRHCGSDFRKKALPFPPVPGATPTSGGLFFVLAFVLFLVSIPFAPFGTVLLVLGTSIWAGFDASTHKLGEYQNGIGGPGVACFGSLLLWIVVFPWYLAIRSRIRAGVQPVKA